MDMGCVRVLVVCLVYTVQRVYTECPQTEVPVVDVCGTDPFTGNVFYIHSVGMSDGFSQCACTLSTIQDNNSITIYPWGDVTPSTCHAYILVVDGLPRGAEYAWCNRQGRFEAVMDTGTPWSVDVTKTSPTAAASDPGHCLLVSGSSLLTAACRNDGTGKIVTRPTTTPTTVATSPPRIVTQEASVATTVTGPVDRTGTPATTEETVASPLTTTPLPTAKPLLLVTSSLSPGPPLAPKQTPSEMDTEESILIGVSVGVLLLIIIIIVTIIVYRICCRNGRPVEKIAQPEVPVLHPMTEVVPSFDQIYTTEHPTGLYPGKVRRVHSNPAGVRPTTRVANGSQIHEHAIMEDGHLFRETSKEYRQHQLGVFKEGKINAERVNTGATIEAQRRYITRVAITASGYNSLPTSRVNSFKRRPGVFITTGEAFHRREGWYRSEPRSMLADSRSRSHSGYLGSL
ncbi:uncharacterized protein LOC124272952 [Haliotis rubra]|uniref:uncharacterized protein LOC124272952 n=1 Tax=Haliotis rubra TaxID=36100 RepID=UPI001EE53B4A|nr:uncharacterized protein LOC124272952 [Haliotis rubra]